MNIKKQFLLTILLVVIVGGANAEPIKKWVDAQGKTHYGVQPPQGASSKSIEKAAAGNPSAAPKIEEEVVLYSTVWCGYCKKARAYLQRKGIEFTERDIEKSPSARSAYKRAGGVGVPYLVKGDSVLRGFRASSYDRFFQSE